MPVLFSANEEFEIWRKSTPKEALALAREYPADPMRMVQLGAERKYPVSPSASNILPYASV